MRTRNDIEDSLTRILSMGGTVDWSNQIIIGLLLDIRDLLDNRQPCTICGNKDCNSTHSKEEIKEKE